MAYDQTVIQEKIRQYIVQASHVDGEKIKDESLLFQEGYFDSMGFILLITFLEEEFKIKTSDSDLLEENFESINAMTGFVVNKLAY
ncbi:MAG: acyl carrier protein [Bacteroidales bacterium]|nr:acyl carrier protein [Bacteroidales bacterium]